MQFDNPANVEVHRRTTAEEIARDFPDGLDYVFAGVGTGGHVTAIGEILRPRWPKLQVFAVEPELSPVLSGGRTARTRSRASAPGSSPATTTPSRDRHRPGSRAGRVQLRSASGPRGRPLRRRLVRGSRSRPWPRSCRRSTDGARILAFTYDTGERYLSVEALFG